MTAIITGEYGTENRRPHWHLIVFGWRPSDGVPAYKSKRGDQLYTSKTLESVWRKGTSDFGDVTFESAGYVCRYSLKKIAHGNSKKLAEADHHEWQPISKKPQKRAVGKSYLEKHYLNLFNHGLVVLPDGRQVGSPPRYYEKWLKENHPSEFERYVTQVKPQKAEYAREAAEAYERSYRENEEKRAANAARKGEIRTAGTTRNEARERILESKAKVLAESQKL